MNMLNRRHFLKRLAAGSALFSLEPATMLSNIDGYNTPVTPNRASAIWKDSYQLPVWKDADVIVVGATCAGVAAAIAAAKKGVRVFVISSFPYPGEDICGSFMYWPEKRDSSSSLFHQLFPGRVAPYPLHVKSVLENEMIRHQVEFLYNSFVTHLVVNEQQQPAGVCIANRSGNQLIRGKVIIDATHHASVARLAGVPFHPFKPGIHRFVFTVVGNKRKQHPSILDTEEIYPAFNVDNRSLKALKYTVELPLQDESYHALMEAEQMIRDMTWDVDQGDSADIPYYVPSSYMKSNRPFEPDEVSNLYVLGPCSAFPREDILEKMEPATIMEQGEAVGIKAAEEAFRQQTSANLYVKPLDKDGVRFGRIAQANPFRPVTPYALAHFDGGGIPVLGEYDVVVVGGGTAGAPAAISAARNGSKVLLLEYLHGLGGISTFGFIGRYTVGYRKGFTAEIDQAMQTIAPSDHPRHIKKDSSEWPVDWKAEWYRKELRKAKGDIWFQTIVNGTLMNGSQIEGILVNTPLGEGIIRCRCVVDSTGSADVAIAAGAGYEYTGKNSLAVQGAGLAKFSPEDHYNNTDWTFVDDTDIVDVTRLFIQAKIKNQGNYDIGKLPQTRERRRIIADYNVSVFDMMNKRTYHDTVSYHKSNFDTHGYTEDIFFTIKPPAHSGVTYDVKLPLRSLLPKGLSGILVTGLGCGVHRDAMPVVRMQPDLQNQGFAAGLVASEAVKKGVPVRDIDMKRIQKLLVEKGNLPIEVLDETDMDPVTKQELQNAIKALPDMYKGLEKVLTYPQKAVPLLKRAYKSVPEISGLYYANVLCMLGEPTGWETILDKVKRYDEWDTGWNYRGMHQFGFSLSELDNYIMALGYSKRKEVLPELIRFAKLLDTESEFSHIRAISVAFETIRSGKFAEVLYRLLVQPGMTGYHITNQYEATQKIMLNIIDRVYVLEDVMRNNALKELFLAKSLYLCGDHEGLGKQILQNYAGGQEGHYARFAWESLNND